MKKIILAASKAPSEGNSQPWEFIIIDDQRIIDQCAELKYQLNKGYGLKPGDDPKAAKERALKQKASFKNASVVTFVLPVTKSEWSSLANGCVGKF